MIKAGVIGWPVDHSLSPRLHGFWLEDYNIDGHYAPLAVAPNEVEATIRGLGKNGYAGINVTLPHKQAALDAVDRVDEAALRIGAVNTIVVGGDGSLVGSNTDAFGFHENICAALPHWRGDAGPVLMLGAGGAARAVAVALIDAGAPEIRIANRSRENSDALAASLEGPLTVVDWDDRHGAQAGAALLVNTTSLGMTGQPELDIRLEDLPGDAIVADIVYAPLTTQLLKTAKARGNPVVDGIGMLLHQARPGFAAWFGVEPEVTDELKRHVLAGQEAQGPQEAQGAQEP
jgi:shikimate dehydrogenase